LTGKGRKSWKTFLAKIGVVAGSHFQGTWKSKTLILGGKQVLGELVLAEGMTDDIKEQFWRRDQRIQEENLSSIHWKEEGKCGLCISVQFWRCSEHLCGLKLDTKRFSGKERNTERFT
jgi:hypothetical protein